MTKGNYYHTDQGIKEMNCKTCGEKIIGGQHQ